MMASRQVDGAGMCSEMSVVTISISRPIILMSVCSEAARSHSLAEVSKEEPTGKVPYIGW